MKEENEKKNEIKETVPYPSTKEDRKEHAIERLEERYGSKPITDEETISSGYKDIITWLKEMARFGNIEATMLIFAQEDRLKVIFFTSEYSYAISARLPKEDRGYLGCTASCRKPRVGETWTRGCDLADGDYSRETFIRIMADIVSHEMKNLQCFN